jgi:hypothetical protein
VHRIILESGEEEAEICQYLGLSCQASGKAIGVITPPVTIFERLVRALLGESLTGESIFIPVYEMRP